MSIDKRKKVMSAFIDSQFGYCPLIWMMHSRTTNNKINRLHERALRITYNEKSQSCSKKVVQFQYTKETSKYWKLNSTKLTTTCHLSK